MQPTRVVGVEMSELEPQTQDGPGQPGVVEEAGARTRAACGRWLGAAAHARLRTIQPLLLALALVAAGLSVYAWAGNGGEGWRSAPILVRDPLWPLWLAATAMTLALLSGPSALRGHAERLWPLLERLSPGFAGVAAVALLWCVWHHGVFVAAGADGSGYVSQASLWRRGDILAPADPLMGRAPWPGAEWTFAPLGYIPAHGDRLAPSYAPGLPLLMAAAQHVAGLKAVFAIVPLTGLLLLASAYSLGRRLAGPVAGAMASAIVATSPIVLMMTLEPMSDLPAAAFWVAATAVTLRRHPESPLLAGLLAALAILVRPNLAPLALPLMLFSAYQASTRRAAVRAAALLALGMLPGLALAAAVHATLYGSPLRSGYGSFADIYSWRHALAGLTAYPARALAAHTPLIAAALAAPFLLRPWRAEARVRTTALFLLAMAGTTFLCYLFYPPFDAWWYLRFVVGAIVWLLVLACAALTSSISRLPLPVRAAVAVLAGALFVGLLLQRTAERAVFAFAHAEERYASTARWVTEHLPASATLICMQHSGSLRHYTGRSILRWDLLPPHKLDRALRFLREHGRSPYIVLDCVAETRAFAIRFHRRSDFSQLDWPARVRIGRGGTCVRVFDPADRARYRAGVMLHTEQTD